MKRINFLSILIIVIALLAIPVSADIAITVQNSSQNYITWSWPAGMGITNESIDGVTVCGFDSYATSFTLSGLNPGEQHTIVLYNATDSGTSTATTGSDTSVYAQVTGFAITWAYILLIAIMFILAVKIHWLFYWFGSGIALYALYHEIVSNPPTTSGINSFFFWIYIGLLIIGLVLWMLTRKRGH